VNVFGGMCALSLIYSYVVFMCLLFALCLLLCYNYSFYVFVIRFIVIFLLCVFCFLFVFSVFLYSLMYRFSSCIVVSLLFIYKFTDHCHRVETQLQFNNEYRLINTCTIRGMCTALSGENHWCIN
jgi:hypothetical protein